jgi:hypothetical protein
MGTCRQLPKRLTSGLWLYRLYMSYSLMFGTFPSLRASSAQSLKSASASTRYSRSFPHHSALGQRALIPQKMLPHMALFHARVESQFSQARRMPNLLRTVPYRLKNFFFAHGCSLYKASCLCVEGFPISAMLAILAFLAIDSPGSAPASR